MNALSGLRVARESVGLISVAHQAFVTIAGCGVNALSSLRMAREFVDTVMACKFFPGPVSLIAGMPDTAPSGAVFFIPSAIFTPLPD
ncbi:hypothetical protein, partial [Escherichia coli]|uniref:hypothetical protein n=1 Tax=Escherichia coli TaxID=562 RepID=UPI001C0D1F3A|nr:hypothetical protein [Escherichia coli]